MHLACWLTSPQEGCEMLNDFSTASLESELNKRKALAGLESVVRQTLANGFSMQDIRSLLARISNEKSANVRNLSSRDRAGGKY
jgi:hypothetical protein